MTEDKPEYSQVFADCPRDAFARGVEEGIDWICQESVGRARGPEAYRAEVAYVRQQKKLAAAKARIAELELELEVRRDHGCDK